MIHAQWSTRLFSAVCVVVAMLWPDASMADDATLNGANTAWILTSTALVLFMTLPGLALFYAGLVQAKNVLSVMMQCFAICCLASILWLVVLGGIGLAEGRGVFHQFGVQLLGVAATVLWSALASILIIKVTAAACGGLRVTGDEETEGLDYTSRGESGYSL